MTSRRGRTKAEYLDAALVLADERSRLAATPYAYAVAHVDIAHVAEIAGVSRTALYRLWETQEAFRADLAAYLAAADDAPWMELDARHFDTPLAYPDELQELARRRLNDDQEQLAADPRPLLRAGVAGYPNATPVTAVIAERERARLGRHATLVERALRSAGRRCTAGIVPADISVVTNCLADGLALAARMTPPTLPLVVEGGQGRPWSLLALAVCAVFDGLSRPADQTDVWADVIDLRAVSPVPPSAGAGDGGRGPAPPAGRDRDGGRPPVPVVPAAAATSDADHPPTGRRLDYLRLAAALASTEPTERHPVDGGGLGYVGLDTLARAAGVTRAAVRKLWSTQAAFRSDLFAHLLATHRHAVVQRLHQVLPGGTLRSAGDALFEQARVDRDRVSHLTFAPQFVLPSFRHDLHRRIGPLLDAPAAALTSLLGAVGRRPRPEVGGQRLAVVVLALVDGMTRMVRTHPDLVRADIPSSDGDRTHSLLGLALEPLLLGLSLPDHTDPPPTDRTERNHP